MSKIYKSAVGALLILCLIYLSQALYASDGHSSDSLSDFFSDGDNHYTYDEGPSLNKDASNSFYTQRMPSPSSLDLLQKNLPSSDNISQKKEVSKKTNITIGLDSSLGENLKNKEDVIFNIQKAETKILNNHGISVSQETSALIREDLEQLLFSPDSELLISSQNAGEIVEKIFDYFLSLEKPGEISTWENLSRKNILILQKIEKIFQKLQLLDPIHELGPIAVDVATEKYILEDSIFLKYRILWFLSKISSMIFFTADEVQSSYLRSEYFNLYASIIIDESANEDLRNYAVKMMAELFIYASPNNFLNERGFIRNLFNEINVESVKRSLQALEALLVKPDEEIEFMKELEKKCAEKSDQEILENVSRPYLESIRWIYSAITDSPYVKDTNKLLKSFVYHSLNKYSLDDHFSNIFRNTRYLARLISVHFHTQHGELIANHIYGLNYSGSITIPDEVSSKKTTRRILARFK